MIRYSGYPVLYQEFLFDAGSGLANIVTLLQNAGWTLVRTESVAADSYSSVLGGFGYVLESRRTTQGLQCRVKIWQEVSSNNYVWFRFFTKNEQVSNVSPSFMIPRPNSYIRIIANPFQFFTFKYNDLQETGNVMMGGVPWLPSFLAPFTVVSATNSGASTVDVVLNAAHRYVGELVTIDGALGAIGLDGTFNATSVNSTTLRLSPCQISGSYTANSARLAGPDRICRYIWSQATAYANAGLFHEPAITFRYQLNSTPNGVISVGERRCNNGLIVNQYNWVIDNDVFSQNKPGAVKIVKMLPYQVRWFDGAYFSHEPFLLSAETSSSGDSRVCAQLWDCIATNQNFGQLDKTIQFDNHSWLVYGSQIGLSYFNFQADGSILLRISNT